MSDLAGFGGSERILLVIRPHWLDAILARPVSWFWALVFGTALWLLPTDWIGLTTGAARLAAAAPAILLGLYGGLDVSGRAYVISDRRVHARGGVLTRFTIDAPLRSVTHSAMRQTVAARILGIGTIGFATAGTDGYEVVWRSVARPDRVLERARREIEKVTQKTSA